MGSPAGDGWNDFQIELIDCGVNYIDVVIGHIEDMLVNTKFTETLSYFMEQHWRHFEDGEENKLIYMDIFMKYTQLIEEFMQGYLSSKLKGFSMNKFIEELQLKKLDGEVYEILYSISDFPTFKDSMLDYKHMKEGRFADLSRDIKITKLL